MDMVTLTRKLEMNQLTVKDNSYIAKEEFSAIPDIISRVADKTLDALNKEGLFVFPEALKDADDLTNDQMILESVNNQYVTSNLMGFIGVGEQRLIIESRFSNCSNDFFFQYLLERVVNYPNIMNMDSNAQVNDKYFDMLVFLFPHYLKSAMRKGPYKTYKFNQYNDSNVKGTIDVARHIRKNIPFVGNIAYNQREHSYDNHMMELIRHTIEYIKSKPFGKKLLDGIKDEVSAVVNATPSFKRDDRRKVIVDNEKNVVAHAYYHEYRALQKLCVFILNNHKHQVGIGTDNLYGIIFDGAWLWEEYVNKLISEWFYHTMNKARVGYQYLFSGNTGRIYPDFISKDASNRVIADAKYKPINNIANKDYLQILAYMFRFESKHGMFLYPETSSSTYREWNLNSGSAYERNVMPRKDITVSKNGLVIPQNADSYEHFKVEISKNERLFLMQLTCD